MRWKQRSARSRVRRKYTSYQICPRRVRARSCAVCWQPFPITWKWAISRPWRIPMSSSRSVTRCRATTKNRKKKYLPVWKIFAGLAKSGKPHFHSSKVRIKTQRPASAMERAFCATAKKTTRLVRAARCGAWPLRGHDVQPDDDVPERCARGARLSHDCLPHDDGRLRGDGGRRVRGAQPLDDDAALILCSYGILLSGF